MTTGIGGCCCGDGRILSGDGDTRRLDGEGVRAATAFAVATAGEGIARDFIGDGPARAATKGA